MVALVHRIAVENLNLKLEFVVRSAIGCSRQPKVFPCSTGAAIEWSAVVEVNAFRSVDSGPSSAVVVRLLRCLTKDQRSAVDYGFAC